jgi:hypothetical protein
MPSDPFNSRPRPDNRPLWDWRDEVQWFRNDIMKGLVAVGQSQRLSNGYVAFYYRSHIVTYQSSGLIVDSLPLTTLEEVTA